MLLMLDANFSLEHFCTIVVQLYILSGPGLLGFRVMAILTHHFGLRLLRKLLN